MHLFDPKSERLVPFADPNGGRPGIGYNDAKVDRDGRYWVGTFDLAERSPRGILYRLEADGRAVVGDSGFMVCNGPAFSPAGDRMYFSDSVGRRLLAYDLDRTSGALSMPSLLVQFGEADGMPDGLCVDSSGALYCAHYGGGRVSRFGPDGEAARRPPVAGEERHQLLPRRHGARHALRHDRRERRRAPARRRAVRLHRRSARPARAALARLTPAPAFLLTSASGLAEHN